MLFVWFAANVFIVFFSAYSVRSAPLCEVILYFSSVYSVFNSVKLRGEIS